MNLKELRELIHEVVQSDISEFEYERGGTRIRIRRDAAGAISVTHSTAPSQPQASPPVSAPPAGRQETAEVAQETATPEDFHIIKSPIVGTFYRSPSPGSKPFVKIGDEIEVGTVLCIIEAMKLMNEIESDVAGEIVKISVENNQPVEYGQALFVIRPR